jgi:hypothetical protein
MLLPGREATVKLSFTTRFLLQSAAFGTSAALFGLTLVWPTWLELLFHLDPDHGSGRFEWWILFASLVASLWFAALARGEWRRMREHTATGSGQA